MKKLFLDNCVYFKVKLDFEIGSFVLVLLTTMPIEKLTGNAIQDVFKCLSELPQNLDRAKDVDASFLKNIMDSPIVHSLAKVHHTLENTHEFSVLDNATEINDQIIHDLDGMNNIKAVELCQILKSPHLKQVIAAHDTIAEQCSLMKHHCSSKLRESPEPVDWEELPVRMIGLTKRPGESLGLTVALKGDDIVVTRILLGGLISKQGLMHVGDIIQEINGKDVKGNPDLLKKILNESSETFTLKIIPSYQPSDTCNDVFMKCNFDFNPHVDSYIPSKEAGLSFKQNDILKIVNQEDMQWWQAQHVNNNGQPIGRAGLVPSVELQERRRVLYGKSSSTKGKLHCKMYKLADYYQEYTDDFLLYEEVALLPPFTRKCLLLVSHDSSIAHHVKEKLTEAYPNLYRAPVIHTSCTRCSNGYEILEREHMLKEVKANRFFEFAEVKGDVFGTKYESIRTIIKSGKTCVKDVMPKNLKFLMTSEFMPYVIFLKPENDIAESLAHCINLTLPYHTVAEACEAIHKNFLDVAKQHQWVPISWLY